MEVKPGYKQTDVGIIPKDWEVRIMDDVATITRLAGAEYSSVWKETPNGEIVALRGFNIGRNRIIEKDFARISNKLSLSLSRSRLCRGDVIYPCVGTIGNAAVIEEDNKYHIQQNIARLTPNRELSSYYLAHYLMSPLGEREVVRFNATSSQPNVLVGSLRQYRIPMPPTVAEQLAIACTLSDTDSLIDFLDQLIAKRRDLKQAAMQQLLTGQTRLPGFHDEWRETSLGTIISRFSTGVNPRENFELNSGGNLYYVTIKNFSDGHLYLDEQCDLIDQNAFDLINRRSELKKDDILFASIGRVGDAYLIEEAPSKWNINESVFTLRPDKEQVVPRMLFYLLTDQSVQDALSQGVTGSTFKSIKKADLKAIPCRLPATHDEQTAIADVLTEMDAELATLAQRRAKTLALKQGMMQELLTGRVRLI